MLPLAVAVASLIAVVAILVAVGRITRDVRNEVMRVVEPARNHVYDAQRLIALEEAEARGVAPAQADGRRPDLPRVRAEFDSTTARLRVLAYRLGPGVTESVAELRALAARWRVASAPGAGPDAARAADLYVGVLTAADRLHGVLDRETDQRRRRIAALERWEAVLIGGAVLPALAALVVLARLGRRQRALVEEARRYAAESERRRRELERVGEEKARFIRGITHDLKNPLGAVDAYAQLLEMGVQGELPEGARPYVQRIRRATQQTLGIIQDLLELARAEAGQLRVERRATDLARLVEEVTDDYRASLEAGGLTFTVEFPASLPHVHTDERRVREILGNLLSNALKYTPEGGHVRADVEARRDGPAGPGEWLVISVRDTGPGIPEDQRERIFEEFQRLPGQAAGGAGLGLAISRRIARLVGGDVTVESRPGAGSTFSLWLPGPHPAGGTGMEEPMRSAGEAGP